MTAISGVPRKPVLLVILDGFGISANKANNGVLAARTPNLDSYFSRFPHTQIRASGSAVGLPEGQMGNSEVGHLTLGAGHVVRQDIIQINESISSQNFYQNPSLLKQLQRAKQSAQPLHLLGLVSDGGVHSHIDHLFALIKACHYHAVKPLLHMITDGRDCGPQTALQFLPKLESALHEAGGAIASIMGRYYAMDRDKRWERTELAWRALTLGKGEEAISAESAIRSAYAVGDYDEFIRPIILPGFQTIKSGSPVLSFNFRKDRPRQIVAALAKQDFGGFDRGEDAPLADMVCMMPYDKSDPYTYLFTPEKPEATLGQVISAYGLAQLHCAETEKYPHVTHFFNGGRAEPYQGEKQLLIPSPKVSTYDLQPEMSAHEVADAVVDALNLGRYAFIVVNFANGDMVGHSGKIDAVIKAVEALDREVGRVLGAAENVGYSVILTADHGNCEEMVDPFSGAPHTQHTSNPVPCLVIDEYYWKLSCDGAISNVAPTILQLMGLEQPRVMDCTSLLLEKRGLAKNSSRLNNYDDTPPLQGVA